MFYCCEAAAAAAAASAAAVAVVVAVAAAAAAMVIVAAVAVTHQNVVMGRMKQVSNPKCGVIPVLEGLFSTSTDLSA